MKIPKLSELNIKINDLQALNILRFVLENGDDVFMEKLDDYVDQFIEEAVNELAGRSKQGVKWDDFILRCEWKWAIEQAMVDNKCDDEKVKTVMTMTAQ